MTQRVIQNPDDLSCKPTPCPLLVFRGGLQRILLQWILSSDWLVRTFRRFIRAYRVSGVFAPLLPAQELCHISLDVSLFGAFSWLSSIDLHYRYSLEHLRVSQKDPTALYFSQKSFQCARRLTSCSSVIGFQSLTVTTTTI